MAGWWLLSVVHPARKAVPGNHIRKHHPENGEAAKDVDRKRPCSTRSGAWDRPVASVHWASVSNLARQGILQDLLNIRIRSGGASSICYDPSVLSNRYFVHWGLRDGSSREDDCVSQMQIIVCSFPVLLTQPFSFPLRFANRHSSVYQVGPIGV